MVTFFSNYEEQLQGDVCTAAFSSQFCFNGTDISEGDERMARFSDTRGFML